MQLIFDNSDILVFCSKDLKNISYKDTIDKVKK